MASSESRFVITLVENKAITILLNVLDTSDNIEIVEQAIWCLGNISGDNIHFRDSILVEGAAEKIARRLDGAPPGGSFVRNASWTLSNFCKGRP